MPSLFHDGIEMGGAKISGLPAPVAAGDPATKAYVDENAGGGGGGGSQPVVFSKSGTLSVVAGSGRFPVPQDATIVSVRAAVGAAPTGAAIKCDVNLNGTTIFTTQAARPTIAISGTSSAEAIPDVTAVAEGDLLSVDIDQVGSGTAGSDLTVVVLLTPT